VSTFFSLATTAATAFSPKRQLAWVVMALVCLPAMYFGERVVEAVTVPEAVWDEEHELLTPITESSRLSEDEWGGE
jgi:hypothetical protein